MIKRALISVSDKSGITEFAKVLAGKNVEILSTGGTAKTLKEAGIPVTEVSDYTGFPELMNACSQVLSEHPLFVITNAYAISSSALMLENVMRDSLHEGSIEVGELALKEKGGERLLSTGIFARWSA